MQFAVAQPVVRAMEVKLKVIGGKNDGVEIAVTAPQFLVGRAEECHLRPKSDYVSRRHAMFVVEGQRATLTDLGSRTGTFINGKLLTAQTPQEIQQDDLVKIGPLEFSVVIKHGLNRQKQARVGSLEEAAKRTANKGAEDIDVTQWLQPDETDGILNETVDGDAGGGVGGTIISAAELLGQTLTDEPAEDADKKKPADANSRPDRAASDMLRNFLRRR